MKSILYGAKFLLCAILALSVILGIAYAFMLSTGQGPNAPVSAPICAPVIVIDAGHQEFTNPNLEPNGPGSTTVKKKVSRGTRGCVSDWWEYELNLVVAMKLKEELIARGYQVVMIRETHAINISNIERAKVANKLKADAFIRIHANGSNNSAEKGAFTICQTPENPYIGDKYEPSKNTTPLSYDTLKYMNEMVNFKEFANIIAGSFGCMLFIGGTYYASYIMETMNTQQKRISFLMLPATSLEKFVVRGLYVTIGFFVLMMVALLLAEATRFLFQPLFDLPDVFHQSTLPYVIDRLNFLVDSSSLTLSNTWPEEQYYSILLGHLFHQKVHY